MTKPRTTIRFRRTNPLLIDQAKKQDPSGAFVWTTYAALQSLQAGLNQSDDPAEIAKYLKANSVDTVMGPLTWDEKGDLKGFEFGVFDWHANGFDTTVQVLIGNQPLGCRQNCHISTLLHAGCGVNALSAYKIQRNQ